MEAMPKILTEIGFDLNVTLVKFEILEFGMFTTCPYFLCVHIY